MKLTTAEIYEDLCKKGFTPNLDAMPQLSKEQLETMVKPMTDFSKVKIKTMTEINDILKHQMTDPIIPTFNRVETDISSSEGTTGTNEPEQSQQDKDDEIISNMFEEIKRLNLENAELRSIIDTSRSIKELEVVKKKEKSLPKHYFFGYNLINNFNEHLHEKTHQGYKLFGPVQILNSLEGPIYYQMMIRG